MSPPVWPPAWALGNRGSGTPTTWELAMAPENFETVFGANAPRAFDFAVESEVTPGTIAPPTTPVESEDGAGVASAVSPPREPASARPSASEEAPISPSAAAEAAAPPALPAAEAPAPAPAAESSSAAAPVASAASLAPPAPVRPPPARPVLAVSGLYGQAFAVGGGRLQFAPTSRLEDWLERLAALSLERQEEDVVSAAEPPEGVKDESPRAGDKRRSPSNGDDDDEEAPADLDQPAAKRSRVGAAFGRTFSRLGRARAGSAATTTTPAPAITSSAAAAAAAVPGLPARPFSPLSLLSRVASGTAATAGASSSVGASRTIKVCLMGDVGAGKTALFNRLAGDSSVSLAPSLVPDYKGVTVRADDGTAINVELWDFPGLVAGERAGPLLSTFFHAAIICFSLEDKENLASLGQVWKPKLNASLHDGHVFVLGLKRDLRPSYPMLGLSFLPTKEPATAEMGRHAALVIGARAYGECSSHNNDNVQGAWEDIVKFIVANIEDRERTLHNDRRRARVGRAVTGFLNRMGRFGRGNARR